MNLTCTFNNNQHYYRKRQKNLVGTSFSLFGPTFTHNMLFFVELQKKLKICNNEGNQNRKKHYVSFVQ